MVWKIARISDGQGEKGATKHDGGPRDAITTSTITDYAAFIGARLVGVVKVAEFSDGASETAGAVVGDSPVDTAHVPSCGVVLEVLFP